jgi:hypothetical protein
MKVAAEVAEVAVAVMEILEVFLPMAQPDMVVGHTLILKLVR